MREAGLERVAYRNLTLGIVALHRGFVPRELPAPADVATAETNSPETPAEPEAAPKPSDDASTSEESES